MAGETGDDSGVLGNLPRSRPGRRSDKRASGASGTPAAPRRKPAAATSKGNSTQPAPAARKPRARPAPPAPRPQDPEPAQGGGPDPVGDALRLAGKFAGLGVKTAGGIIRRLPGR